MIEPEPEPLADALLVYARAAITRATALMHGTVDADHAEAAYHWMRSGREALEARRLADEPLAVGERAVIAEHVKALRAQVATAEGTLENVAGQRNALALFLGQLARQFESAETGTAARVAARIRRELSEVLSSDTDETSSA